MSRHSGSKCRSYQATYSSTIARGAGCVVTSSTRPSPSTHSLRPSRRASRYSAPVRIFPSRSAAGMPEIAEPGRDHFGIWNILVEDAHMPGEIVDRGDRGFADRGVVERQVAFDDTGDQPGLARRKALIADFRRARHIG